MNESKISVRYPKAFFSLSVEKNLSVAVKKDVDTLLHLFETQPGFKALLASPVLPASAKKSFVDKVFKEQFHAMTIDFLHLLLKNGREIYLFEICLNFNRLYSLQTGVKFAQLTTAVALDKIQLDQFSDIIQQMFGSKAEVNSKVDPSILGGFVLKVDDQQMDASVSTQLRRMKREMVNVIKN
ncbi:MAG: ATP synthase F1 subunit delta [Marinilabiliales bacterium]|nr:ATP synthase F1 subunit delta [Marinilabiliales bacterium]